MRIRQENPDDYAEVYELVKKSFATTSESDGTEQDYLNDLRKKKTFIPELSLVAEDDDGKIVGQIVLYEMIISTHDAELTELVLSPICVHPEYFLQGIARAMIEGAIHIAHKLGYSAVFLCGNPEIYRKMGFRPSYEYKIFHINDKEKKAEWCMVREIKQGALPHIERIIDIE